VRVSAHDPCWLLPRDADDTEDAALADGYDLGFPAPQPGDPPGLAASVSGHAAALAARRPPVGQQWRLDAGFGGSAGRMSVLLPGGGSCGGAGGGGDGGGGAARVARADASPLLASGPRYQHLRRRVACGLASSLGVGPSLGGVGSELVLGASLLRWFVAELTYLEKAMLSRLFAPGRFSDSAVVRCLRSEDGPLPASHRTATLTAGAGAGEVRRRCLAAVRSWASDLCPDLAALLAAQRGDASSGSAPSHWARNAAASDWDALLPDPCATLAKVGSCWLALIGGCERMAAPDRAAVALAAAPFADPRPLGAKARGGGGGRSLSHVPEGCPLVVLANRLGVVAPIGAGSSSSGGVGWRPPLGRGSLALEDGSCGGSASGGAAPGGIAAFAARHASGGGFPWGLSGPLQGAWLVACAEDLEAGADEAGWGGDFWDRLDARVLASAVDPNEIALGAAATGGAPKASDDDAAEGRLLAAFASGSVVAAARDDLATATTAARAADCT
jgi:hypothetical protein